MSLFYENYNSSGSTYLTKKRLKEPSKMDSHQNYDQYNRYRNNDSRPKYTNMNSHHSYSFKGNYNSRNNYTYNSKNFYSNRYQKNYERREPKKIHQKNLDEGIRNLSNYDGGEDVFSQHTLSIKEEHSLNSFSTSTNFNSPYKLNDRYNPKDVSKLVSNITGKSRSYHQENYIQSPSNEIVPKYRSESNLKPKKEKDHSEAHLEIPYLNVKSTNYVPFNRNSIDTKSPSPLDDFEVYPQNIYTLNLNINIPKNINTSETNKNVLNELSFKSCYLLSKIPNWRLVSKFVPISSLKQEKFEKINEEEDNLEKKEKNDEKKSFLVYSEKFEDMVEDYLGENKNKKKELEADIFGMKSIVGQYHYDISFIKNKILNNKYKLNYLDVKSQNLRSHIEESQK